MLHLTMKAHVRRSGKPVLILGCDSRDAVTIDEEGNLRGYRLTSLKSTVLEAQLRMALDTKGVGLMLNSATESDEGEYGVDIAK